MIVIDKQPFKNLKILILKVKFENYEKKNNLIKFKDNGFVKSDDLENLMASLDLLTDKE